MEKSTKRLILRFVFWGVILAAPVVFFSMGKVYLNAYITGERVNSVMIPVLETVSERSVRIGSANAHIGFTSRFEFQDIEFFEKSEEVDTDHTLPDARISRGFIQFKPLTLFTDVFRIDSLFIDGYGGTITYNPDKSYFRFVFTDRDGMRREVNLDRFGLENIHIRSFKVKNSGFHYKNRRQNLEYILEDYYQEIQIEGVRVMNILLVYGSIGGVLKDPAAGNVFARVLISGRLQINFDDGTFILRSGNITIDEHNFSFTAFLNKNDDIPRLSILFDRPREPVEEVLEMLPSSLIQWLRGELPDSRYQVKIIYSGEHATDQT